MPPTSRPLQPHPVRASDPRPTAASSPPCLCHAPAVAASVSCLLALRPLCMCTVPSMAHRVLGRRRGGGAAGGARVVYAVETAARRRSTPVVRHPPPASPLPPSLLLPSPTHPHPCPALPYPTPGPGLVPTHTLPQARADAKGLNLNLPSHAERARLPGPVLTVHLCCPPIQPQRRPPEMRAASRPSPTLRPSNRRPHRPCPRCHGLRSASTASRRGVSPTSRANIDY